MRRGPKFRYVADPHSPVFGWSDEPRVCRHCAQLKPGYTAVDDEAGTVAFCERCLTTSGPLREACILNTGRTQDLESQLAALHPNWSEARVDRQVDERDHDLRFAHPQLHSGEDFSWPAHCGDYLRFEGLLGARELAELLEAEAPARGRNRTAWLKVRSLPASPAGPPTKDAPLASTDPGPETCLEEALAGRLVYLFRCRECKAPFLLRLESRTRKAKSAGASRPKRAPQVERKDLPAVPETSPYRHIRDARGVRTTWVEQPRSCAACGKRRPGYAAPWPGDFRGARAGVRFVCEPCLRAGELATLGVWVNEGDLAAVSGARAGRGRKKGRGSPAAEPDAELRYRTPPLVTPSDFAWPAHCSGFMRFDGLVGKGEIAGMCDEPDDARLYAAAQRYFVDHAWSAWRDFAEADWDRVPADGHDTWPGPDSGESDTAVYLFTCLQCKQPTFYWNWE